MLKKIIIIILVGSTLSCSTAGNRIINYEGFNGNLLTVHVSEFIPDENQSAALLSSILNELLDRRAFMILACYVSLNINRSNISPSNDALLNDSINRTVSRGALIEYSFNEKGYCEAIAEYDTSDFFAVIESVNRQ